MGALGLPSREATNMRTKLAAGVQRALKRFNSMDKIKTDAAKGANTSMTLLDDHASELSYNRSSKLPRQNSDQVKDAARPPLPKLGMSAFQRMKRRLYKANKEPISIMDKFKVEFNDRLQLAKSE